MFSPTHLRHLVLLLLLAFGARENFAVGPADTNAPNTLVRFEVRRGTNAVGAMDFELFDQDRPETVRNFLLYLQSGAYSNGFIHRCVPGFIAQGGGFSVTNVASTNNFSTYRSAPDLGKLRNEFNSGPVQSNLFGTIAMAKVGGDPDSATSQWFFNLNDNSTNLNVQNGGFTVFGRVLMSTNEGTNVLKHFNTLTRTRDILDLGRLLGTNYAVFSDLPADTTETNRVPRYDQLYHVSISLLNRANVSGSGPPNIQLLSPASGARYTNGPIALTGTASDDAGIGRIVYRVGNGPLQIASGTTNWTTSFIPPIGFNTVTLQSIDCDGNFSTSSVSSTFLFVANVTLDLEILGSGRVKGLTSNQPLQLGRYYTVSAEPRPDHFFNGWSGSVTSATPSFTFLVPTNATNFSLTAKFISNPFKTFAGEYRGIFRSTNTLDLTSAGAISLTLTRSGLYSGHIRHRGGRYIFAGRFSSGGGSLLQGTFGGVNRTVTLRLEYTNSAGVITGGVIGGSSSSELQLERVGAPRVVGGAYTFALQINSPNSPSQVLPGGHGYGTAKLSRSAALTLAGVLPDGTAFTAASPISRAERWPIFLSKSGGNSLLLGWVQPSTNSPTELEGDLQWFKTSEVKSRNYPVGFTNRLELLASAYVAPTNGERVLNWTNGIAEFTGADLLVGMTNLVQLTSSNTLTVTGANLPALTFNLDLKKGLARGTFVHPWLGTTNEFRGAMLRSVGIILGQFLDGEQTGLVEVTPAP